MLLINQLKHYQDQHDLIFKHFTLVMVNYNICYNNY